MIKMKSDRYLGILLYSCLNQLNKVSMVGISTGTLGNLKDNRAVKLACCLGDTLNDLHVVNVESTNSITAVISLLKHLGSSN